MAGTERGRGRQGDGRQGGLRGGGGRSASRRRARSQRLRDLRDRAVQLRPHDRRRDARRLRPADRSAAVREGRAGSTRSPSRPSRTSSDEELVARDPGDPAAGRAGADGRGAGGGRRRRDERVHLVPADVPARLRRHRALRRLVRDRELAVDHDRAAHARVRDASDARRDEPSGSRIGPRRGAGRRCRRVRRRASSRAPAREGAVRAVRRRRLHASEHGPRLRAAHDRRRACGGHPRDGARKRLPGLPRDHGASDRRRSRGRVTPGRAARSHTRDASRGDRDGRRCGRRRVRDPGDSGEHARHRPACGSRPDPHALRLRAVPVADARRARVRVRSGSVRSCTGSSFPASERRASSSGWASAYCSCSSASRV